MFEAERIPQEWLTRIQQVDQVWVPSFFNLETFIACGVPEHKVYRIPEPVDIARFRRGASQPREQSFRFPSVFRWHLRKGWDVLLKAYLSEFAGHEDVALVIRADPFETVEEDLAATINEMRSERRNAPRIQLISKSLSDDAIPDLYRSCHAFVLPTRGEGWGRPYVEAMASGIPVIGTEWGGSLDFMNHGNSFLIACEPCPVPKAAVEEWPAFAGQRWVEPSTEHLRQLMREVYEGGPEVSQRVERASREVELYDVAHVVGLVHDQLSELWRDGR